MTIREVNRELQPIKPHEVVPGGQFYVSRTDLQTKPTTVIEKICAVYNRVKPVIVFVSEFWLVPKKWREALQQFNTLMSTLCPV